MYARCVHGNYRRVPALISLYSVNFTLVRAPLLYAESRTIVRVNCVKRIELVYLLSINYVCIMLWEIVFGNPDNTLNFVLRPFVQKKLSFVDTVIEIFFFQLFRT